MRVPVAVAATSALLTLASCTTVGLPVFSHDDADQIGDRTEPLDHILLTAICQLQKAAQDLKGVQGFDPARWTFVIGLTPISERELTGSLGDTGKNALPPAKFFLSWSFAPGVQLDATGHTEGLSNYSVTGADLVATSIPGCSALPRDDGLDTQLQIEPWLSAVVRASDDLPSLPAKSPGAASKPLSTISDKSTFLTDIKVVRTLSGGLTYNSPLGTNVASLSSKNLTDEKLGIALSATEPKTKQLQLLPYGLDGTKPAPSGVPLALEDQNLTSTIIQLDNSLNALSK